MIGGYNPTPSTPDDPILVRMTRTPCKPGLPARDQHRAGHVDLLSTPFSTFERNIRDQMARILGGGGFDPARDIDAITVNRWPHGYAYEYNPLWDPDWKEGESPCEIGRKRVRPHHHRQLRRRGRGIHRRRDGSGVSRRQRVDRSESAVGDLNKRSGGQEATNGVTLRLRQRNNHGGTETRRRADAGSAGAASGT